LPNFTWSICIYSNNNKLPEGIVLDDPNQYNFFAPQSASRLAFSYAAATYMAIQHFNHRNATIVPEITTIDSDCSMYFPDPIFVDTQTDAGASVRGLYNAIDTMVTNPCAVIGSIESAINQNLIPAVKSYSIPILSYYTDDARFVTNPGAIGMTLSASGRAKAMIQYLQSTQYLAFWYITDSASELESAFADALIQQGGKDLHVTIFRIESNDSIKDKLQQLKDSGIKTIILSLMKPVDLLEYAELLNELGMLELDYIYILPPEIVPTDFVTSLYGEHKPGTPIYKLLSGALVFDRLDGFRIDPENDPFLKIWKEQNNETVSKLNSLIPKNSYYLAANDYYQTTTPANFASYVYDTVMAIGFGGCIAEKEAKLLEEELIASGIDPANTADDDGNESEVPKIDGFMVAPEKDMIESNEDTTQPSIQTPTMPQISSITPTFPSISPSLPVPQYTPTVSPTLETMTPVWESIHTPIMNTRLPIPIVLQTQAPIIASQQTQSPVEITRPVSSGTESPIAGITPRPSPSPISTQDPVATITRPPLQAFVAISPQPSSPSNIPPARFPNIDLTFPPIVLPKLPEIDFPVFDITLPPIIRPIKRPNFTLPPITRPSFTLPPITRPSFTLPPITRPNFTLPPITLPKFTLPPRTRPNFTLPPITLPKFTLPPRTRPKPTFPPIDRSNLTLSPIIRPNFPPAERPTFDFTFPPIFRPKRPPVRSAQPSPTISNFPSIVPSTNVPSTSEIPTVSHAPIYLNTLEPSESAIPSQSPALATSDMPSLFFVPPPMVRRRQEKENGVDDFERTRLDPLSRTRSIKSKQRTKSTHIGFRQLQPEQYNNTSGRGTLLAGILQSNFHGATGEINFGGEVGKERNAKTIAVGLYNIRPGNISDMGKQSFYASLVYSSKNSIWVRIKDETIIYRDGTDVAPKIKREFVNENFLSKSVRAIGLTLMGIAWLLALSALIGLYVFTKDAVVQRAQPFFLKMICYGSILTSTAIFTVSWDEGAGWSDHQLDIACAMTPWFFFVGIILTFCASFTKLWRVDQVLQFRRRAVTIANVMKPWYVPVFLFNVFYCNVNLIN
jgi:hypothetical protein